MKHAEMAVAATLLPLARAQPVSPSGRYFVPRMRWLDEGEGGLGVLSQSTRGARSAAMSDGPSMGKACLVCLFVAITMTFEARLHLSLWAAHSARGAESGGERESGEESEEESLTYLRVAECASVESRVDVISFPRWRRRGADGCC